MSSVEVMQAAKDSKEGEDPDQCAWLTSHISLAPARQADQRARWKFAARVPHCLRPLTWA